jgi:hypothetical protein
MKNQKKIQLALSIALLRKGDQNGLQVIREMMEEFKDDAGAFLGLGAKNQSPLNQSHIRERYALQFENCVLDVDMVANLNTKNRSVQRLSIR